MPWTHTTGMPHSRGACLPMGGVSREPNALEYHRTGASCSPCSVLVGGSSQQHANSHATLDVEFCLPPTGSTPLYPLVQSEQRGDDRWQRQAAPVGEHERPGCCGRHLPAHTGGVLPLRDSHLQLPCPRLGHVHHGGIEELILRHGACRSPVHSHPAVPPQPHIHLSIQHRL